eukprot:486420_1
MNITHMQWLFPLDKNIQLNIFPTTFNTFLNIKNIVLPVFQRKYCWKQQQFRLYWKDLNDIASQNKKHHIGRFTVFENKNEIVIMDGQQRITTTLVVIISIRDQFIKYNKTRKHPTIDTIITTINSVLFNTVKRSKHRNYKNAKQLQNYDEKNETKDENIWSIPKLDISEGKRFDCIRFVPTYLDREPLYNLIINNGKYEKYIANNGKNNNIYNCKKYFDNRVANIVNGGCNKKQLNQLKNIFNTLLSKFTFVYIGIPIDYWNKGFLIYQWLFEKSLVSAIQLRNDRPGQKHMPCELFKNYILSFFMSYDMNKQEQIYRMWIAIEKRFNSQNEFNQYLIKSMGTIKVEVYDIYRDFVKVIEEQLTDIKELEYPKIVENFVIELKNNVDNKFMAGRHDVFEEMSEMNVQMESSKYENLSHKLLTELIIKFS